MECVILAGGVGSRMRPLTEKIPKSLLPVAGKPFVDHQLSWLAGQGVQRVILCIGHKGELLRRFVGEGDRWGLSVVFVDEGDELRGTGGALRLARDEGVLQKAFFVLYGDSYLRVDFSAVWTAFRASGLPALMTVLRNEGQWDRSNALYRDGRVLLYDKFAREEDSGGLDYIDYGLSVISRRAVEEEIPPRVVTDLATVFHRLSVAGALAGFEVRERFYEVGSPAGLQDLEAHLGGTLARSE